MARGHQFCGHLALFGLFLLSVRAATICTQAGDLGKTVAVAVEFQNDDGSQVSAQLLCGDDPAATAGRIATTRRTRIENADTVLKLARVLQTKLDESAPTYDLPSFLDLGGKEERPRILKTGGLYSRRANEHAKKKEFALGVADLVRALSRPNIDPTAHDKLFATLQDQLAKAVAQRTAALQDGDLTELFEDLEIDDNGSNNADVDSKVLKRVYRDLSVKYHPDKNAEAAKRFNRIRDAYEVLSDPMKTMLYDTGGIETVRKFEGGGGDLERTEGEERQMTVTLEDVYKGTTRKLSNSRRIVCRTCRLHPELPRCQKCTRCPGEKEMRMRWLNQHQYMNEEVEIPSKEKCTTVKDDLDINIEKGMSVGERIHFPHMSNQLPKKITGDFQVTLRVSEHPLFKRVGNDLVVVVQVSLFEALLGFTRELTHLDGHKVTFGMERGQVLKPGRALQIDGEGMPVKDDSDTFGKLLVKFQIDFPEAIPLEVTDDLEKALSASGQGPKTAAVTRSIKAKRTEL